MTLNNADQLIAATGCTKSNAELWLPFLQGTCKAFEINTPMRLAAFLAQVGHESAHLAVIEENLNYSAKSLRRVWPRHFPDDATASAYHRQPEKIANRAYANRMGNGDEASGDGWKYRGKGLIQLTGKDNHQACGEAVGEDFVANPERLLMPVNAALSAGWFWSTNKLNRWADEGDMVTLTKRINGGTHGLDDRLAKYDLAMTALA